VDKQQKNNWAIPCHRAAEGQVIYPQPEQESVKRCDVQLLFGHFPCLPKVLKRHLRRIQQHSWPFLASAKTGITKEPTESI